jgi:drug/metabolite transporter (DMT)-like permease
LVVLAAFCWGVSAVVAKKLMVATKPISVERLVCGRTVVAALLLSAWIAFWRPLAFKEGLREARFFLLSGSVLALVNFTYYSGVRDAGVAVGILLQYLSPFLVFVYSALCRPGSTDRRSWGALLLALGGVALVSGIKMSDLPSGEPSGELASRKLHGIFFGLSSALLFALFTLRSARGIERKGYWPFTLYAFIGAAMAGIALRLLCALLLAPEPSAPAAPGSDDPPWSFAGLLLEEVGAYLYLGSVGTLLPFSLYLVGVERIGAVRAGIASTLEPVFGAAAAFLILKEELSARQVAGGGITVAAILLLSYWGRSSARGGALKKIGRT